MKLLDQALNGVVLIEPTVHGDDRGYFKEVVHPDKMAEVGIHHGFVQTNHSRSQQWTLRGLHFQHAPYGQAKLVRAVRGSILDVVVDVRPNSDTFGQSYAATLTDANHHMLYVPIGFAHGFLALTDVDVEYFCSDIYSAQSEGSIHYTTFTDWPLPEGVSPIVSSKDADAASLEAIKDTLHWPVGT